jgi:hypothetical protein
MDNVPITSDALSVDRDGLAVKGGSAVVAAGFDEGHAVEAL